MKIVLNVDNKNPEDIVCKIGSKIYGEDMSLSKQNQINDILRKFIIKNTKLSDYEEDNMWMSYRYCVGRHTIASSMHAGDIWKNCRGRLTPDRELFTAFDINREIENSLSFMKPYFHFPITSLNRIYTSAVDIVCEFMEDYNINSVEDFIKYRDVYIKLYDNVNGYTFETVTWEEYLRQKIHKFLIKHFNNEAISEDYAWKYYCDWKEGKFEGSKDLVEGFNKLTLDMPKPENYYFHNFEDLFVWNDLVHCFDYEHHHKSILTDGTECEWFWSWTNKTELRDDGYYYKTFGYKKIRIPVNKWHGNTTSYIPDDSIKKDIY